MPSQTSNSSKGELLSQVPEIRSFEFDKNAIGAIKSSVNKFRGCVSLPVDFLTLPGREGLDVKISALYSSNIKNTLSIWNIEAPTGILGLGWDMPIEMIVVDKAGSGSTTSDTYYLISGGSANPMVKTGQTTNGQWIFQLRNFQFWSVLYDTNTNTWTIVKENGFVYTYGSGTDKTSNATQWGVKWDNWIGSSSQRATQEQYAIAWNLASIVSPANHAVQYYYENTTQKVMQNGLEYTQASYLKKVIDSYGRIITFEYGNKYGYYNPDRSHGSQPIIEYQAEHTQQPAPNAYQDRYETMYLDSVTIANADGDPLYGLKFTYDFVNAALTGDSNYSLMYKRCLKSVFQFAPDGRVLPAMNFEYNSSLQTEINPCALKSVIYPEGGKASFTYKKNFIASTKKVSITNPINGSVPRVWFGPDFVVFTYSGSTGMKVVVRSWNGQWVSQDVTGAMAGKVPVKDSLQVIAGDNFFTVCFRNSSTNNEEFYFYRNDDRGAELRFGTWKLYNGQPFILTLKSSSAKLSTIVPGENFVIAYNKDYTKGPYQGFSYNWQTAQWDSTVNSDAGAPPVPPSSDSEYVAISAYQNFYMASSYTPSSKVLKSQLYYRDLDGSWKSSANNPFNLSSLDIVTEDGSLYLELSLMPTGVVMTYVTASDSSQIKYSLKFFQWDGAFRILNPSSPLTVPLQSPIVSGKSQYDIFRTVIVGSTVNNNLAVLRNIGGDQSIAAAWVQKMFTAAASNAAVAFASGDDVAVMCTSTGTSQNTQVVTYNPNTGAWSSPSVVQSEKTPTLSGDYMTLGRYIYFRGTDGTWRQLNQQLNNLNYPESLQNRGPHYMAYQDNDTSSAGTYIAAIRNGAVALLPKLSTEKMYVSGGQAGTYLASARFLVTYPSSASSFDTATTLNLYDLDEVNLDPYVVDTPVACVEIFDNYDPTQNYSESFFYANSSESQIVYNAATGVAQYPLVTVVQGVKVTTDTPPQTQPFGRSEYFYSNGLAQNSTLYPSGGVQNYQNILNGIELASRNYSSANVLVSSQLDYWKVYTDDPQQSSPTKKYLLGGYARCYRSTTVANGVTQESYASYDQTTGVLLWQEKSYFDFDGTLKLLREQYLYAFQVAEYKTDFLAKHIYTDVAMRTSSVSVNGQNERTYISSKATTYKNWASASPSLWLAYETYDWTTPGGTTAPSFNFGGEPSDNWLLNTRILSRSTPDGLITEQVTASGLVSSFIYDDEQQFLVAQFPNASLASDEAGYYGFEEYESGQGWNLGSGTSFVPNSTQKAIDAHTGTRSLSIAPSTSGSNSISRSFTPKRQDQQYIFSAWVKKPEGFNAASGNASWNIAVSGQQTQVVPFPDTIGEWAYVYHVISLSGGSVTITITAENANSASAVLVDNLRFSPFSTPFQAYAYDSHNQEPDALLGANGDTSRTVYDSFQQRVLTSNPADKTAKIERGYFSRLGNTNVFSTSDPNHTLTIGAASGGMITQFTHGNEWKRTWNPSANWTVEGTLLTQSAANQEGSLTSVDPALAGDYTIDVEFNVREALTAPLGIHLGSAATIQWNPSIASWQLVDGSGRELHAPVKAIAFSVPSTPYSTELDSGTISSNLQNLFLAAGYLLPGGSVVSAGGASTKSWTITSVANDFRYALVLNGNSIDVFTMNTNWVVLSGSDSIIFFADGKLIFSYKHSFSGSLVPTLFFGNKVAISEITTAIGPQATISFDDARGLTLQSQQYVTSKMSVAQAISDSMGRQVIRTKPAFVPSTDNPLFAYCEGFAIMNWTSGTMTGMVANAYPADGGYPFSRQVYAPAPIERVIEEGIPGTDFAVGAHSTKYAYGTVKGAGSSIYATRTTTDPNGNTVTEVKTLLDQIIRRISNNNGVEIKTETIYNDAGNAGELRSPNYFAPPTGSTADDWISLQTFDYANRLLTLIQGKEAPVRFLYDSVGNVRFTQDPQGVKDGTYNYSKYDILGRQVESGYNTGSWSGLEEHVDNQQWPATPPTWRKKYTYDGGNTIANAIGRIVAIDVNNGTTGVTDVTEQYRYDIFGNITTDTLSVADYDTGSEQTVEYQYDNAGNILHITYPQASDGSRLNLYYRINSVNQIDTMSEQADLSSPFGSFTYDAAGNPATNTIAVASGTSIERTYAFNSPYWLTDIREQKSGADLFRETMLYTSGGYNGAKYYDGMIAACSLTIGGSAGENYTFQYSYDAIGQVLNAQNQQYPARNLGVTKPVNHDANGNFTQLAAAGINYQFNYFAATQEVQSVLDQSSNTTVAEFLYDDNGNATHSKLAASGLNKAHDLTLNYDPALMLPMKILDATVPGQVIDLKYGGKNDRVLKQVSGGAQNSKKLYIRGTNTMPIMERVSGSVSEDTNYVYGPGGLIAMKRGGKLYSIAKDHLGSIRAVIDGNGSVVASYEYLTYGGLANIQEPADEFLNYLYTGQEYDREIGLYNYRARFYCAEIGRFIAIDLARQYFSPYLYASNNPVLYIDPTGMFSFKSLISAVAGAIIGIVEIAIGVVIDVVAGVLEVVTGGLGTPATIALAALSGTFYGAGISAVTYSVFNFDDFSWKDYGISMGIGALGGAISGGLGAAFTAGAESVSIAAGEQIAARAGQEATTFGAKAVDYGLKATKYVADFASKSEAGVGLSGYLKDVGKGILKSEALGITKNTAINLATGNDWDKGLDQVVFSAALSGTISGSQIKLRASNETRAFQQSISDSVSSAFSSW